jgi:hypothetical protein
MMRCWLLDTRLDCIKSGRLYSLRNHGNYFRRCESIDIEEFTQRNVRDVTFLDGQVKKVYSGNLIKAK